MVFVFGILNPMDPLKRATESLHQAEASLRDLVSDAASGGDYASVLRIASWAKAISDMMAAPPGRRNRSAQDSKNGAQTSAVRGASRRQGGNGYPRFFRRGDQLVRVAWSKRNKDEYQHKTSLSVLRALAPIMTNAGKDGRIFSTDDVLPISDADGSPVPAYQAYVCIALLKQSGLIDQHGRQGYSIPRVAEFIEAVNTVWEKLPAE